MSSACWPGRAAGTAVVDLSHRGVVTVSRSGPAQLAQHPVFAAADEPGAGTVGTELLLLTVQGRIEYDARVVDDGETTWLMVEAEEARRWPRG